jgi:L-fucose isomerase-like protein
MRDNKPVLLGLCPIGKFVFSHEDAVRQKCLIQKKLDEMGISFCDLDGTIPDGMVRDQKHVEPVVKHFKSKGIDALFTPHCNFGTEGAVGMIARELEVPVLLWGPRDEAPLADGTRLRDSLCGMLASSKVLHKLNVPFTYIENCRLEEKAFEKGVTVFLKAVGTAKSLRTARIGQIGTRIDFFWSTIYSESELLERFGVQVMPVDMVEFLERVKTRVQKNKTIYKGELSDIKKWFITDGIKSEEGLLNSLAMRDELFDMAELYSLDAFSIQSFDSIQNTLGPGMGLGESLVQEKIPIAAESDIHGAISSIMLKAAAGIQEPSFFPEFTIRHPDNENAVLMWHASAPISLRHQDFTRVMILPPWILKGLPASSLQFRLKDGSITVCRFDGDRGEYRLGIGEGKTVPGPHTREVYAWMEVDNWPRWEKKLIEGPYIHHCSCIYDHCGKVLEEACKYIPGLVPERFDI